MEAYLLAAVPSLAKYIILLALPLLIAAWYLFTGFNAPPGPRGWPLIGLITSLTSQWHISLESWANTYGPVMSLRFGPKLIYVLSDAQMAYEALVTNGDIFKDRNPSAASQHLVDNRGGLLINSGQSWKEYRRFFLSAFRKLGVGKSSLEPQILDEANAFIKDVADRNGKAFDPALGVSHMVTNIICCIALGKRFESNDPTFATLLGLFQTAIQNFSFFRFANFLPFIFYTPAYNAIRKRIATIRGIFRVIIKEHRLTFDPDNERDVIDMYLSEVDRQGGYFSEVFLEKSISDLFGAGSDTTTNGIMWSILLLAKYPHVQEKVQEEIDRVIGPGRTPSMNDKPNMPYTSATIMEVMRFRPVVPVIYRHTTEDTTLGGYKIPEGAQVFINIWAVLNDSNVFDNPHEFNPARFIGGDDMSKDVKEAFIPFGAGRRVCLGENLARMELFLLFTSLFQRFDFREPDNQPDRLSLEGNFGMTHSPHPFKICANAR